MISLLLPTRGRPALVERLFASISSMSAWLDQIEVILYLDVDDADSHHLDSRDFRVQRIIGPAISMGGYNSACLAQAQGDVIVLANDDMVIRTAEWDHRIRSMHAEFPDQIYLGYANDLFKKSKFCTFPILSRRTCDLLIDPFPEAYHRAFIDVHLFDIFKRLQHAGCDRIRYCDDLIFEHLHYRSGKAPNDATYGYTRSKRFADDPIFIELVTLRSEAARRLLCALQNQAESLASAALPASAAPSKQLMPSGLGAALPVFARVFLMDAELPLRWRFFLWYWFIGRYLAAQGLLRPWTG